MRGGARCAGGWWSRRESLAPGRPTAALLTVSLVAALLVVASAPAGGAQSSVFIGGGGGQFQPAVAGKHVAWEENTRANPGHFDVYTGIGPAKTKVNPPGTNAANGGIDGTSLVYQEWKGSSSDLRFFNLSTRNRKSPPRGVNTDSWEYWPSHSDDWLLFGRRNSAGTRRVVLFNLATKTSRVLDKVKSERAFAAPGQVNGNYAVWYRCTPTTKCDVFRYQISTRNTKRIPDAGMYQRVPSVSEDGTVYFARAAGKACEVAVKLMRYRNGVVERVANVPFGEHIGDSYVDSNRFGNRVFFDRFKCGVPAVSDIYLVDERTFELAVAVDDSSGGHVTSDPSGIDCAPSCLHSYAAGAEVTLTATPQDGYEFAGWTGADCEGAGTTCTLTLDGPTSVGASFNPILFTLSVTGGDGGTVTSYVDGAPDPGINCGAQCSATYTSGTEVSLVAIPDDGFGFTGWSGDCTGVDGCSLSMNQDREVTATFEALPPQQFSLSIERTGDRAASGWVVSDPTGIECGNEVLDCTEAYRAGTTVVLSADTVGESARFDGWSENCDEVDDETCTVTLNRDEIITSRFVHRTDD